MLTELGGSSPESCEDLMESYGESIKILSRSHEVISLSQDHIISFVVSVAV